MVPWPSNPLAQSLRIASHLDIWYNRHCLYYYCYWYFLQKALTSRKEGKGLGLAAQPRRGSASSGCPAPPHQTTGGTGGRPPSLPRKQIHPEEQAPCLTQGDQSLVVPPHHSLVEILLPAVQRLPFLLIEVHGNVIERERHLESQTLHTR